MLIKYSKVKQATVRELCDVTAYHEIDFLKILIWRLHSPVLTGHFYSTWGSATWEFKDIRTHVC